MQIVTSIWTTVISVDWDTWWSIAIAAAYALLFSVAITWEALVCIKNTWAEVSSFMEQHAWLKWWCSLDYTLVCVLVITAHAVAAETWPSHVQVHRH